MTEITDPGYAEPTEVAADDESWDAYLAPSMALGDLNADGAVESVVFDVDQDATAEAALVDTDADTVLDTAVNLETGETESLIDPTDSGSGEPQAPGYDDPFANVEPSYDYQQGEEYQEAMGAAENLSSDDWNAFMAGEQEEAQEAGIDLGI